MCGIVGILGHEPVAGQLVDALKRLEYRGYDSAGVATLEHGALTSRKAEGKLRNLEKRLHDGLHRGADRERGIERDLAHHVRRKLRALLIEHVFRIDLMISALAINAVLFLASIAVFLALLRSARRHGSLLQGGE